MPKAWFCMSFDDGDDLYFDLFRNIIMLFNSSRAFSKEMHFKVI